MKSSIIFASLLAVIECSAVCGPVCLIYCEFGNVLDDNGCPTCACNENPDPCSRHLCEDGEQCVLESVQCVTEPCRRVPVCKPITEVQEACNDPLKVGPCRGVFPRFYFNQATQQCQEFSWGGCFPNKNNFEDLATCQSYCPPDKVEPVCPPVCDIYCEFGNVLDENGCPTCQCKPSPCEGVNCRRRQRCVLEQVHCVRAPCPPVAVCKNIREVYAACHEPKEEGPCEALVPRYYFNPQTRRCERFNWGGCEANGNNFPTLQICRSHCERIFRGRRESLML